MEQISFIFSKFKQQIGGGGSSQPDRSEYAGLDPHSAQEEDGFLVVGQTATERTSVCASSFDIHGHQAPPSYDQVAGTVSSTEVSMKSFAMFATCAATPFPMHGSASSDSGDTHNSGHHAAITGVPFQLNPRLQEKERLSAVLSDMNLQCKHFEWQKYEYDFDFERQSLRELCTSSSEGDMGTYGSSSLMWER